ncbi:uncharacterized protein L969DRAFT_15055 [Mixia osmundae IAM 14324]|nr:uncharacterized protein L969DRAFT_15055 [Mixia osmundae IAM 14324]KEI42856.1 hypothetical protein L969DRAFT_15055 [Mixia osmundae IAM 14324]
MAITLSSIHSSFKVLRKHQPQRQQITRQRRTTGPLNEKLRRRRIREEANFWLCWMLLLNFVLPVSDTLSWAIPFYDELLCLSLICLASNRISLSLWIHTRFLRRTLAPYERAIDGLLHVSQALSDSVSALATAPMDLMYRSVDRFRRATSWHAERVNREEVPVNAVILQLGTRLDSLSGPRTPEKQPLRRYIATPAPVPGALPLTARPARRIKKRASWVQESAFSLLGLPQESDMQLATPLSATSTLRSLEPDTNLSIDIAASHRPRPLEFGTITSAEEIMMPSAIPSASRSSFKKVSTQSPARVKRVREPHLPTRSSPRKRVARIATEPTPQLRQPRRTSRLPVPIRETARHS